MPFVARVEVYPDIPPESGGGFASTSFADLLHREIHLPGMDPAWHHTLIDVAVAGDRSSAELTIHSQPRVAMSLDRNLRVTSWQPAAYVRAHDQDGNVLAEVKLSAPLRMGQTVEVRGDIYTVQGHEWPGRDPETGCCAGDIDWQHVTLKPDPQPAHVPVAAE
jgi:hypothetical protein